MPPSKQPGTRSRFAKAHAPTLRLVTVDRDAYVEAHHIKQLKPIATRYWSFHGEPTTLELPGQRIVKNLAGFPDHKDDDGAMLELLREYGEHDCPRPTGYADVFHSKFRSPPVRWSNNAALAPRFVGGWQEAVKIGAHRGQWYKYDLRSAYLWAGLAGLPRVDSYRFSDNVKLPGVYRVKLWHPVPGAPYPFNVSREVLASDEEIETYSLPVRHVVAGVSYNGFCEAAELLDAIRAVSTWKQAARAYWGRWAQVSRVMCHTAHNEWALPSLNANLVWAHLIVSRVKMKVWNDARRAVHVFVDSIITDEQLRTGPALGDWKLEKIYPDGVMVRATGWYGPIEGPLDKAAGLPHHLRAEWEARQALIRDGKYLEDERAAMRRIDGIRLLA